MSKEGKADGWAMTVSGPLRVSELGPTHIHEHLHIDCRPILELHGYPTISEEPLTIQDAAQARWNPGGFPDNYHQTDVDLVVAELEPFTLAGGRTIVEVTPSHLSRHTVIGSTGSNDCYQSFAPNLLSWAQESGSRTQIVIDLISNGLRKFIEG